MDEKNPRQRDKHQSSYGEIGERAQEALLAYHQKPGRGENISAFQPVSEPVWQKFNLVQRYFFYILE